MIDIRVYNERDDKMLHLLNDDNIKIVLNKNNVYVYSHPSVITIDETNKDYMMMYSGHTDKNGVKIYEADIILEKKLKIDYDEKTDDIINKIEDRYHLIINKNGLIDAEFSDFGWEGEDLVNLNECEIVGNIHQNPELKSKLYKL